MSKLAQVAAEVSEAVGPVSVQIKRSRLSIMASEVNSTISRKAAAVDRDAEWQRVHSYIADVLKDTHVLYAKLARLEGDFGGEELTRLERVSEAVLQLGNELSGFSKAFYEGKYDMAQSDFAYGEKHNKGPAGDAAKDESQKKPAPEAEALGDLGKAEEDEGAAAALLEGQEGSENQEEEQTHQQS